MRKTFVQNTQKYLIFASVCRKTLVNEPGNVSIRYDVLMFWGFDVVVLPLTAESLGIGSENCLFVWLNRHRVQGPNLISGMQFSTMGKLTISVCSAIRGRMANEICGRD